MEQKLELFLKQMKEKNEEITSLKEYFVQSLIKYIDQYQNMICVKLSVADIRDVINEDYENILDCEEVIEDIITFCESNNLDIDEFIKFVNKHNTQDIKEHLINNADDVYDELEDLF